jgi:hypothetical protein
MDTLRTQSERTQRKREATEGLKKLGVDEKAIFWISSQTQSGLKELVENLKDNSKILGEG